MSVSHDGLGLDMMIVVLRILNISVHLPVLGNALLQILWGLSTYGIKISAHTNVGIRLLSHSVGRGLSVGNSVFVHLFLIKYYN